MRLTITVDDADPASLAGLVAALEYKPPIRAAPATDVGRLTAKADALLADPDPTSPWWYMLDLTSDGGARRIARHGNAFKAAARAGLVFRTQKQAQHAAARLRQVLKSLDVPGLNGV